jgi:hypothetical protein
LNSYHWINRRVTPTSHQSISPIRTGHVCKRFACIVVVICNVSSCASSGRRGWRGWGWGWSGWAWTGRSSNTAFRRLETTYRGALETAVASRILAAAALVLALRTAGTERPIAQKVLELATRVRGACSIGSGSASIRGVYTTKSRDHHVRSISINVCYRGE